ncbi:glycoside hydrolase family 6 protein [Streptomyces spectabilis]|uniref:Glucanase n=1 Tax=Streptomyces spectabilis TaxID=68270 RepID=A0A5P2X8H7_STRST|nr:glycoside hydrolase family 6 protein [Streptomyces spectabilis]MBB5102690.1 endoglucanase [Streptomyces spectabilis]MCI3901893.1 glycoside hydrolase family 6 protein [Streptomyces spectabilis]QEV59310.1 endoglucanase [Streptomyces spectabilis]GGV17330.1 glucanase [Streptomyces spectabilis]
MPSLAIVRRVLVAALGLCALAAVPAPASQAPRADVSFWVNPDTSAARQAAAWMGQGRFTDAWALARIAVRPQAEWLSKDGPEPVVRSFVERAAAAGRTAVLVTYFVPDRDCGAYSAGGARDADHYRTWIDDFAAGLGTRGAYVIVEPDAVALAVAGCAGVDTAERYELLAYAVDRLKRQPGTKVYVDAGNATWIPQVRRLVAPLRRAGVDRADGFALNVSNFHTDAVSAAYGHRLARALGGTAHFVIDTSRNGNGPYAGVEPWCNPPGRALGTAPTTRTGDPAVDAYLWVKRPGESDGTCRGGPEAGALWPRYALELARNSRV